ncbi:MAG TPA: hypothetical protein VF297_00735 [Pyrinomonadaceae bacterium]
MLFRTQSAVYGINANSNPSVIIVGLPDLAVRESRERIRAAGNNGAFFFPL